MLWLDHLLFGNGYGLKSPYFDDVYYWLSGRFYVFQFGYGAQLHSFQWTHPLPGEGRYLAGKQFVAFNSRRCWFRVMVSWRMADLPDKLDECRAMILEFKSNLDEI